MVSSLPTARCSPGRTDAGKAARRRRSSEHGGRWGSSTLSAWPCLCSVAGQGELRMRTCSPPLALVLPKGVTCCQMERGRSHSLSRGGDRRENCPGRWRTTPSPCPTPHHPPHSHPEGRFPTCSPLLLQDRLRCPATWTRQGRANTGDGCGTGSESGRRQPPEHPQHQEKPCSTLQTRSAGAGVQARARLGCALPAPADKKRET